MPKGKWYYSEKHPHVGIDKPKSAYLGLFPPTKELVSKVLLGGGAKPLEPHSEI